MENIKAEMLVAEYAAALNAANVDLIPAFYTADAVFMPDNTRKLTKADLLKSSQTFLNQNRFHISYSIQDITVKDEYAFVQATAQTKTVNPNTNTEVFKTSQDFFVLRNEQNEWKIFRYIFNNVKGL
jgi:ketosteroid isomerase-like protein